MIFLFFSVSHLVSQESDESLDDLFEDPPEDVVVENTETDHREQFETNEKVIVKGSFSSTGGIAVGWSDYPDPKNLKKGLGASAGATAVTRLKFDARPEPEFALVGNFYTEIDPGAGKNDWSTAEIDELFADYNWLDKVFFRVGKHVMTWGQGRIFTPGNLMDDSDDGVAFRATMPTVLDGFTIVSLSNSEYADEDESLSASDLAVGALADKVFGGVRISAGSKYQREEGLRTLASFKTVLWKTDFLSDIVVNYDESEYSFQTVAGFFREWTDFKLYGEYCFDGATEGNKDHSIGLAAGYKKIFGSPFDFGTEWQHTFYDGSGSLITGISWSPWRLIKAKFGIPFLYGSDNSRYVADDDNDVPKNRRISAVFTLELSSSF